MEMKFNNVPNKSYKLDDGTVIWESRSVAVVAFIIVKTPYGEYILAGKRGKGSADYQGLWNVPCGYLDKNENGTSSVIREVYEETGLELFKYLNTHKIIVNNLYQPWFVNTDPNENRQNVSLRYGCVLRLDELPELNSDHSEPDEIEELKWISINDINDYDWAFNHNRSIEDYWDIVEFETLL